MLSVVMTIYKRSVFTEKTIASLLENKVDPIELIVCMDWSDRETHKNIENLYTQRKHEDGQIVCIVPMKDVWLVNLWNAGIQEANNENVFTINDDILLSKWYDQQINEDLQTHCFVCPLYTEGENDFAGDPKRKRTNINWHARATTKTTWIDVWPIDTRLKLWYSDDYIFRILVDLRKWLYRTEKCIVHHYRSKTVCDPKEQRTCWQNNCRRYRSMETDFERKVTIWWTF